jgi:hypothetical protein
MKTPLLLSIFFYATTLGCDSGSRVGDDTAWDSGSVTASDSDSDTDTETPGVCSVDARLVGAWIRDRTIDDITSRTTWILNADGTCTIVLDNGYGPYSCTWCVEADAFERARLSEDGTVGEIGPYYLDGDSFYPWVYLRTSGQGAEGVGASRESNTKRTARHGMRSRQPRSSPSRARGFHSCRMSSPQRVWRQPPGTSSSREALPGTARGSALSLTGANPTTWISAIVFLRAETCTVASRPTVLSSPSTGFETGR